MSKIQREENRAGREAQILDTDSERMDARLASMVHLILLHIDRNPALFEQVAASTRIPGLKNVLQRSLEAVGTMMVGPLTAPPEA